ncbi:recombinase family protein [Natronoglycomyces albus]|uniref:Recombinase family protein n=1 Tax=Natronoglycomyces albus TaxID=2811108 RepID=A0A895XL85_9ACTN|nr:recombinase family protein [Natronoglycomyces albus]QSB06094.1 recombinase family protein [Natronoglycomyces albus]
MSQEVRAKRAVLYLRVSSRGQVQADYDPEGNSIPAQRKACQRRAEGLGMEVVDEYVEPGKSGLTVDGRPKFLEMMARIRNEKDVGAIIVYARLRMRWDIADAVITRRELKKLGAQLVSIMDYIDDSHVGDLVTAILDGVNEYQSRASGAEVAYKMGTKAANGGTPYQAPIGFRNAGETVEGREIRTVSVDEERAPFIRIMFELYASGTYSLKKLQRAVTDAGLRTRPSKRCPAGREVPMYTVGTILRNRYYFGRVTFKGVEHQGRHEPLVSQELFDRVQEVLPEAQHRAVHTGFFGRLFVAVEDGDRVPRVIDNQVTELLEPLVSAMRSRAGIDQGKTKDQIGWGTKTRTQTN